MKQNDNCSSYIMAFDANYRLCAIFRSVTEAAHMTGIGACSISQAVSGKMISSQGKYWRAIPKDTIIDSDDLSSYTVFDADKDLRQDRLVYVNSKMGRGEVIMSSKRGKLYKQQH